MKHYLDLTTTALHGELFEKIDQQLSDSLARTVMSSLTRPNQNCEFRNADSFIGFNHVRMIFSKYEQLLQLKEELIANLLQENEKLKSENQKIPVLEEQIRFLEQHPTTTYVYNAPHYQAERIEKHTDIEVGTQSISNGGVGISYSKPTTTSASATAEAAPTTTQPQTYDSSPEKSSASLTFDQRILRESTPVQVFYEKVSPLGFFALSSITCLTDASKVHLIYEITKPGNTPFAVALLHNLKYYEHCLLHFEFSKSKFYNHIAAALDQTVSAETIKKNFMSINNPNADYLNEKYSAWKWLSQVQEFYNELEKI